MSRQQKIGYSLQNNYCLPMPQVLQLLRSAGFDGISPVWQSSQQVQQVAEAADKMGLILQSLHGSLSGTASLWTAQPDSPTLQELMQGIEDCRRLGIPVLVVHPWAGLQYDFPGVCSHVQQLDRLVEFAAAKNVRIAFENLEGHEFLELVLDRYRDTATVGYCWDSGHEICYARNKDYLALYGDRLLMTHLNDNMGITRPDGQMQGKDDMHLIPGDGISDWAENVRRLKQAKPQEILNFELKQFPKTKYNMVGRYDRLPLEEFIRRAYAAARSIADAYGAIDEVTP